VSKIRKRQPSGGLALALSKAIGRLTKVGAEVDPAPKNEFKDPCEQKDDYTIGRHRWASFSYP